jgi:hypothetical protein
MACGNTERWNQFFNNLSVPFLFGAIGMTAGYAIGWLLALK